MGTVTVSSPRFVNISTLGFGCMRLPEYQLEDGSWQVDQEKIQYAASKGLGNPGVCCALSGMQTYEMVDKNAAVASLETPMTEKEWREVGESLENLKKVEGVLGAL